jgi:methylated-DNA-[protein]-cysteine S-methyltransferase
MMQRYFDGERERFDGIALNTTMISPFNATVYDALRTIVWGQITTYGALAELVGAPGAARAVGAAMASNPWPIIVPCHRVLPASHTIGGFSAHGGADTKRALLSLEGVHLDPPSLWDV